MHEEEVHFGEVETHADYPFVTWDSLSFCNVPMYVV